ncbi:hypothetical protein PR048_016325 [Dryococelus australis]|uniref:Uncharacterized protein n=1 Tax=Dryococelus australis TaxID=614101 RepID=A0ABQ9HKJ7_9NEOP|nr:hypothetical protein PR048_016325 [Dryococelus australis]
MLSHQTIVSRTSASFVVERIMKMAQHINAEFLISLIEARLVLWDKTMNLFKDRIATRNVWCEVCLELKPDFEDLEDGKKINLISVVTVDSIDADAGKSVEDTEHDMGGPTGSTTTEVINQRTKEVSSRARKHCKPDEVDLKILDSKLAVKWKGSFKTVRFLTTVTLQIFNPNPPNKTEKMYICQYKLFHGKVAHASDWPPDAVRFFNPAWILRYVLRFQWEEDKWSGQLNGAAGISSCWAASRSQTDMSEDVNVRTGAILHPLQQTTFGYVAMRRSELTNEKTWNKQCGDKTQMNTRRRRIIRYTNEANSQEFRRSNFMTTINAIHLEIPSRVCIDRNSDTICPVAASRV